jgi:hypothetical protein
MQKRIFRVDGQAFLATRDGAYWETHGTLAQAIAGWTPREAQPERALVGDAVPMAQVKDAADPTGSEALSPEKTIHHPARTTRRRRGAGEAVPHRDRDAAAGSGTETGGVEHAAAGRTRRRRGIWRGSGRGRGSVGERCPPIPHSATESATLDHGRQGAARQAQVVGRRRYRASGPDRANLK